jgi:hypothetical protein
MQPDPLTRNSDVAPSAPGALRARLLPVLLDLGFVVLTLLLVAALWRGLSVWLAFGAELGLLALWDLGRFALRQPTAARGRHVRWLALALIAGAALAVLALVLRIDLGFGLALGLAVLLIVLLAQVGRVRAG